MTDTDTKPKSKPKRPGKRIVLFADGTGNSSSNPQKTNVWRTYQALDRRPGSNQIAFYDNGVGTSSFTPTAMLGLMFGWGLARNVRQIYGFLCRTYEPGGEDRLPDEVYGFGFSRGAFTMRVAMALIADQGIIKRGNRSDDELDRLVVEAYRKFRINNFTPSFLSFFLRPARDAVVGLWNWLRGKERYDPRDNHGYVDPDKNESVAVEPSVAAGSSPDHLIKFIGVWDTVDAYGLPVDELTRAWDMVIWPLTAKDHDLSPRIAEAYHALALDEQRETFEPMMWNEDRVAQDQTLEQVWFPGVHSNVGGGYPDDSLAIVSLDWMMEKSGLDFLAESTDEYHEQFNINGPLYDSRSGGGSFYRYGPRSLERLYVPRDPGLWNWIRKVLARIPLVKNNMNPQGKLGKLLRLSSVRTGNAVMGTPQIHSSVIQRLMENGTYAPINLPEQYGVVNPAQPTPPDPQTRQPAAIPSEVTAASRRLRQGYAWNKVWRLQLLYFFTLACMLAFVVYPLLPELHSDRSNVYVDILFGTLSDVIRGIPELVGKIPGLGAIGGWAEKYKAHSFVFITGLAVLAALIWWSFNLRASLRGEMRANWHDLTKTGAKYPSKYNAWRQMWAGLLDDQLQGGALKLAPMSHVTHWLRVVVEILAVLIMALAVVVLASRIAFVVADGGGLVCDAQEDANEDRFGSLFAFDPKDPCFDTALNLTEGKDYTIEFYIDDDWADDGIEADANGWWNADWRYYLSTPLLRHFGANWFQPIARIDSNLFDRYPIQNSTVDGSQREEHSKQNFLVLDLKARRSDRLFLYLNDVVLFLPGRVGPFYSNNKGSACVRVLPAGGATKPAEAGCEWAAEPAEAAVGPAEGGAGQ